MTKSAFMNWLRNILLASFLFGAAIVSRAQKIAYPMGKTTIYRVKLADKKGSAYSLRHPERFLSAKALARRERQGLSVDSTDLPISAVYLKELRRKGFQVVGGSKWNNTVLVKTDTAQIAPQLRQLPFVKDVRKVFSSPDSVKKPFVYPLVADTSKVMGSVYGQSQKQIEQLNGIKLHDAGFTGEGMTIAIVDGGFMNADKIPVLKKVHVLGSRDFFYPYTADVYSLLDHGTRVLSCMAAVDSFHIVGTAPKASYYLLRSECGDFEVPLEQDAWAMAVEYADSVGVDVINSSLGYADFDGTDDDLRYVDLDGRHTLISHTASLLASKGIVLVNSAGNEGNSTWKKITVPSDADDILTVGAIGVNGVNTIFSSVGPSQDGRVKPDVVALGGHASVVSGRGTYVYSNGTSFSSPITCGMVACLWQALPNKTASEIINLVRRSADRFSTPDNIFGYGLPDFWKAYELGRQ